MKKVFLFIIFFLLAFVFYWIAIRPSSVRKQCLHEVEDLPGEWPSAWKRETEKGNEFYRVCLVRHGLKPENILVE